MSTSLRIAILTGSSRPHSNNAGIAEWVQDRVIRLLSKTSSSTTTDSITTTPLVPILDHRTDPLPLGPLIDDIVPQGLIGIPSPTDSTLEYPYPSARTREFSRIIQKLDALIIVTPQYNWSMPGELKNTIDHMFHEWVGLPTAVITLGGRGGGKAAETMNSILGGIRAQVVSCGVVGVALPRDTYISGDKRSTKDDVELLAPYEAALEGELLKVIQAAESRRKAKAAAAEKKL
ncbi:flavo protein-like protein [Naematelia encephala]|uniref:Flavo protein-like protein n=1 Tax=Naematelia encephala TaxID=71784 RepID=A0A1Y2BMB2_9TREE|nr:flavo protein-like protein [Naematelia encephala]